MGKNLREAAAELWQAVACKRVEGFAAQEFTRGLKPGDTVFTINFGYGERVPGVETVKRITPTGQVTLANGTRFSPQCSQLGMHGYLIPYDERLATDIRNWYRLKRIKLEIEAEFEGLSLETAEKVLAVIRGEGVPNNG